MKKTQTPFSLLIMAAVFGLLLLPLYTPAAWAGGACSGSSDCTAPEQCMGNGQCDIPDGTCTDNPAYDIKYPKSGEGLVSAITNEIKSVLKGIDQNMFEKIAGDAGFQNTVRAASTLFVAVYGVLFTFGMVQITLFDFAVRLIKLGIINLLLSGGAWGAFSDTFVTLFNNGTDDIINQVSTIAVPDASGNSEILGGSPFGQLDNAIVKVVSAKMAITLMATFATGPYGFIIGIILIISLGSFLKSVMNALWVYTMSLVMKTLLFGLAPIFIPCLLFARTRHLFDGWLNQIVNASLQPIFLFTFFAFFVILISGSIDLLIGKGPNVRPVCWVASHFQEGNATNSHYWRFAINCNGKWQPFDGVWGFTGAENQGNCGDNKVNPIGVLLPLTLWILADLASRFNHIVIEIAKDIAGASTDLRMGAESLGQFMNGGAGQAAAPPAPSTVGSRPTPGGGVGPPGGGGGGGTPFNIPGIGNPFAANTGTRPAINPTPPSKPPGT